MDSGNTVAYILGGEEACHIEHLFVVEICGHWH
jgi:hypothetical protein